ncbi:Rv3654c family TadE-like protein [Actinophytocola xinjiangensis]|uniref:Rv3654c family TadE-like protein n=1 Tax=Actinophytocola xinjiangensis TaxID=485602 RepID=UPI001FE60799|nr:Rv3654c family TadE-like protein [Actinophytocola xinjiangensis]
MVAVIAGGASLRLTGAEDAGRFLPNSTAGRDRGSATLWAVAGIAVLFALGIAVVWAGVGVNTRHRAVAAADLSALAAASNVGDGEDVACGKAQWVSTRMRVTMTSCRVEWPDALVEVSAVPPGVLESFGPAEARARAGPVERPVGPR